MIPRTYSFLDNQCAMTGPGISSTLSQGGNAEEGFDFAFSEDKNTMTIGADGSGIVTRTLPCQGAGRLVGLAIDFQNMPATTDLLIKADSTDGETLFTTTSSATDIGTAQGRSLGIIGIDEANGAMAATDGSTGGAPFRTGLFFDVAQADAFTSGNEKIVIGCWITQ